MDKFVHLKLRTDYSLVDGCISIDKAIDQAKQYGIKCLALTDYHNMFGLIKFYTKCRENGIKPIVGCELRVEHCQNVTVLCKNINGYRHLCELITRSYIDNMIGGIPYVRFEWIQPDDIIVYSQDLSICESMKFKFGNNYYIELQRIYHKDTNKYIKDAITLSKELSIPVVATHSNLCLKDQHISNEIKICINESTELSDNTRHSDDCFFKSPEEMCDLFSDIPSAVTNTLEIAKICNLELNLFDDFMPPFSNNTVMSTKDIIWADTNKFLIDNELYIDNYRLRLKYEQDVINKMGFSDYFLIVADFIQWAKGHDIIVGPGRGSSAGSLVAYALGITDVDPIKHNLLFERFLNPERVSLPDIDIDVEPDGREPIIQYIRDKYGDDKVSQIATFSKLTAKSVLKDVGRVLGVPFEVTNKLTSMITGKGVDTLEKAYNECDEFREYIDKSGGQIKEAFQNSKYLEGLTRNVGKHAAGILIAPTKITDFCPLYEADGTMISQFDKEDVEKIGLVKFDLLGLKTLKVIKDTLKASNLQLPTEFDDKKVYDLLSTGNSIGCFQLESDGMRRLLKEMQPNCLEDIASVISLYRPGTLNAGMVSEFVRRKNGTSLINYYHNDLKDILQPTYGVIVYQEQVMQIAQQIAGYTLSEADLLRRAMGYKDAVEMAKHKDIFVKGGISRGYTDELSNELFELIFKFSDYGFNRSHAIAYATISYYTAYLKTYATAEFIAALMNIDNGDTDRLYELYDDCKIFNIELHSPNINFSAKTFESNIKDTIRYGLSGIKGLGDKALDVILKAREFGQFKDIQDFKNRTKSRSVTSKVITALQDSGAFDSIQKRNLSLKELIEREQKALGFNLQYTYFQQYEGFARNCGIKKMSELYIDEINIVNIFGVVKNIRHIKTKTNKDMYIVDVTDDSASLHMILWDRDWAINGSKIIENKPILIEGIVKFDEFRKKNMIVYKKIASFSCLLPEQDNKNV